MLFSFHTAPKGDIGYYDDEGRIHYLERLKDMIKCMDNQVAPCELEEHLLKEHEGIEDLAVVGIPHPQYGEAPAAVISLKKEFKAPGVVTEDHIKRIISSEYMIRRVISL